ncbi:rna-directed dna polymerase from mobile element jockey-like [Willisornis vidua]|uniref:Rna-directed dna polymerase from mobile element jockey-like n=1 Tax=Willisornis vidua TaxID=1566151 RepID=A0ABQ9D6G1_9PASS|nr:rna-directed dna polymerase from mobile element jockey-like [Willisornis vidua]
MMSPIWWKGACMHVIDLKPTQAGQQSLGRYTIAKTSENQLRCQQAETGPETVNCQGLILGLALLIIFVGYTDFGIECTLNKFVNDMKLCGVVGMLEERDTIRRDLDSLERWAHAKLMNFNKTKCKVLLLGRGNPKHKYRVGGELVETSTVEEDLGMLMGSSTDLAMHAYRPESHPLPGLH